MKVRIEHFEANKESKSRIILDMKEAFKLDIGECGALYSSIKSGNPEWVEEEVVKTLLKLGWFVDYYTEKEIEERNKFNTYASNLEERVKFANIWFSSLTPEEQAHINTLIENNVPQAC